MKSFVAALLTFIGMLLSTPALAKHHRCDAVEWTDGRYNNTSEVWGYDSIDPPAQWGHRKSYNLTKLSEQPYKGKPAVTWHKEKIWWGGWTGKTFHRDPPPADWKLLELAPCEQMMDLTFDVREDVSESGQTTDKSPEYRFPDPQAMFNLRMFLAEKKWLYYNDRTEGVRLTLTLSIRRAAEMLKAHYNIYEVSKGKRALRTVEYRLPDEIGNEVVAVGPTNQWDLQPNVAMF